MPRKTDYIRFLFVPADSIPDETARAIAKYGARAWAEHRKAQGLRVDVELQVLLSPHRNEKGDEGILVEIETDDLTAARRAA